MKEDTARKAAELLVSARRTGHALEALPDTLAPTTREQAYAIQDQVTASIGDIGGWKTSPAKDGVRFNWAPIPAAGVFTDGAEIDLSAFPRSALELEIGFIVGSDLPARSEVYTREEVAAALSDMRVCLELFGSRYADRTAREALEVLADAQNAAGVVIGTGLTDWKSLDLASTDLTLAYAGQTYTQSGGPLLDELLEACCGLANDVGRLGGLRVGQVIITGARIGPINITSAGPAHGRIEPVGAVNAGFR